MKRGSGEGKAGAGRVGGEWKVLGRLYQWNVCWILISVGLRTPKLEMSRSSVAPRVT